MNKGVVTANAIIVLFGTWLIFGHFGCPAQRQDINLLTKQVGDLKLNFVFG